MGNASPAVHLLRVSLMFLSLTPFQTIFFNLPESMLQPAPIGGRMFVNCDPWESPVSKSLIDLCMLTESECVVTPIWLYGSMAERECQSLSAILPYSYIQHWMLIGHELSTALAPSLVDWCLGHDIFCGKKCNILRRIFLKCQISKKFRRIDQTPKVPFPVAASTPFPCNTCSLDPRDSAFQTASCDCWTLCRKRH